MRYNRTTSVKLRYIFWIRNKYREFTENSLSTKQILYIYSTLSKYGAHHLTKICDSARDFMRNYLEVLKNPHEDIFSKYQIFIFIFFKDLVNFFEICYYSTRLLVVNFLLVKFPYYSNTIEKNYQISNHKYLF